MKLIKATEKDIPLIQDLAKRSWENAYAEILSQEQMLTEHGLEMVRMVTKAVKQTTLQLQRVLVLTSG